MRIDNLIKSLSKIKAEYGDSINVVVESDHGQSPEYATCTTVGNCWFGGGETVFVPEDRFEEDYPDGNLEVNAVMIWQQKNDIL